MPALLSPETAPRSEMTVADFMDRVRGDLGLRDSSFLTDADLVAWGNEAQDLIAVETHWYRTSHVTGTTAGTKEYSLPAPTTGRCLSIEEIVYDNEQLIPTTLDQLQRWDWEYRQSGNGRPQWFYPRGNSGFGLHYTPDTTDIDILTIIYVGKPPRVTGSLDLFYVPHGAQDGLIIYAKMLASEKDAHGEGARRLASYQSQWSMYMARVKKQIGKVSERRIVSMGGDMNEFEDAWDGRIPFYTNIAAP